MESQLKMVAESATKLIQRHSWSLVESSLRALFQLSVFHSAIVQLSFFFFGGGGGGGGGLFLPSGSFSWLLSECLISPSTLFSACVSLWSLD